MPLPIFLAAALLALPPGVDPTLFPGADTRDPAEVQLAGLAELYPGGVLHKAPQDLQVANLGRLPKSVELPRNVFYVRVYDLKVSKTQLADALTNNPMVIVDFRYVYAEAPDAEEFADDLAKAGLTCSPVHGLGTMHEPADLPAPTSADKPAPLVLVLVNGQTAGPLEAWLAAFQETESVLAVGTATAGQPGTYHPAPDHPDYYVIDGELLPESGSVLGTGLQPRFIVEVTPEQNKLAYDRVESGATDVPAMLRRDRVTTAAAAIAPAPAAGTAPPGAAPAASIVPATIEEVGDPVLQRAVDVVAALQVLGRVPSLKAPGASKATDAAAGSSSSPARN
jgi:hypothetical protein